MERSLRADHKQKCTNICIPADKYQEIKPNWCKKIVFQEELLNFLNIVSLASNKWKLFRTIIRKSGHYQLFNHPNHSTRATLYLRQMQKLFWRHKQKSCNMDKLTEDDCQQRRAACNLAEIVSFSINRSNRFLKMVLISAFRRILSSLPPKILSQQSPMAQNQKIQSPKAQLL